MKVYYNSESVVIVDGKEAVMAEEVLKTMFRFEMDGIGYLGKINSPDLAIVGREVSKGVSVDNRLVPMEKIKDPKYHYRKKAATDFGAMIKKKIFEPKKGRFCIGTGKDRVYLEELMEQLKKTI